MSAPTIILMAPQMGENIGFVMRTLTNFGGADLRLVSPRDAWPNPVAITVAAGAAQHVRVQDFPSLKEATEGLSTLVAVTARQRDLKKTWMTLGPNVASEDALVATAFAANRLGLVFGPEKTGLSNEDISFCHRALTITTNPTFPSLNLSHAVAVCLAAFSYENSALDTPQPHQQAPKKTVNAFLETLESALEEKGFFVPAEKALKMKHNLRDLFLRTPLSEDDVHTLFGAVKTLARSVEK
ncbi:MAG: RNA methyltransferase [Holosporaceae bacterium]|nr:MAG: RNA methyltransferase [Holosporaceae bacterium]